MKRTIPFLLALLLLLPACGQIAPEPETETEITTEEITTEIETTTEAPFVPTGGESAEITWRTLDVNSAEGREAVQWLAEQREEYMKERPTEFPMGKDKTIRTSFDTIVLQDNKTGKETVLLEKEYLGDAATSEEALRDEVPWRYPRFVQALDERYFICDWAYWEGGGSVGVYDTKSMRMISIKYGELQHADWYTGKQLIFADAFYLFEGTYGPWEGPLHLLRVDLKALNTLKPGEPLMAMDVLASIPGKKDANVTGYRIVTQDERYFIMADMDGLRVFDLQQKKLALELPASLFGPDAEIWSCEIVPRDNRVYWVNDDYLAEITLP